MYEVTVDELAGILRKAKDSYNGSYDSAPGRDDWAESYARFVLENLEAGSGGDE